FLSLFSYFKIALQTGSSLFKRLEAMWKAESYSGRFTRGKVSSFSTGSFSSYPSPSPFVGYSGHCARGSSSIVSTGSSAFHTVASPTVSVLARCNC
ncbi:hypothetical protein PMAYCL1PPCAC_30121, partial [Pristionchus mayeri]